MIEPEIKRDLFDINPFKMQTLDQLGLKYGTDKASSGHNYLQYYERFFAPIKDHTLDIMEIGIWEGASLKLWQEYFPNARIYGVDNQPMSQWEDKRIQTYVCDQGSVDQLTSLADAIAPMSIIIDDGSHEGIHQWTSFNTLFPTLKPGGMYIIEDLLCSYDVRWNYPLDFKNKILEMVDQVQMSGAIPNSHICANKQEAVKKYHSDYLSEHIEWVFVACGIVFIKKM